MDTRKLLQLLSLLIILSVSLSPSSSRTFLFCSRIVYCSLSLSFPFNLLLLPCLLSTVPLELPLFPPKLFLIHCLSTSGTPSFSLQIISYSPPLSSSSRIPFVSFHLIFYSLPLTPSTLTPFVFQPQFLLLCLSPLSLFHLLSSRQNFFFFVSWLFLCFTFYFPAKIVSSLSLASFSYSVFPPKFLLLWLSPFIWNAFDFPANFFLLIYLLSSSFQIYSVFALIFFFFISYSLSYFLCNVYVFPPNSSFVFLSSSQSFFFKSICFYPFLFLRCLFLSRTFFKICIHLCTVVQMILFFSNPCIFFLLYTFYSIFPLYFFFYFFFSISQSFVSLSLENLSFSPLIK